MRPWSNERAAEHKISRLHFNPVIRLHAWVFPCTFWSRVRRCRYPRSSLFRFSIGFMRSVLSAPKAKRAPRFPRSPDAAGESLMLPLLLARECRERSGTRRDRHHRAAVVDLVDAILVDPLGDTGCAPRGWITGGTAAPSA